MKKTKHTIAEDISKRFDNPPEDWDKFHDVLDDLSDQCLMDDECVRYEFSDESAIVIWPNLPSWDIGYPGTHLECYCFRTVDEHHPECEQYCEDPETNRKRLNRLVEDLRRADPETINALQEALDDANRR